MTMTSNYIERRRSGLIMRYQGCEYNLDSEDFHAHQVDVSSEITDEQIVSLNRMIDDLRRRAGERDTKKVCDHGLETHLCLVCGSRQSDTGELA